MKKINVLNPLLCTGLNTLVRLQNQNGYDGIFLDEFQYCFIVSIIDCVINNDLETINSLLLTQPANGTELQKIIWKAANDCRKFLINHNQ